MTVTVENIGGGGSTFPPKGTQVRDFIDTFERPDAGTLGTQWGNAWYWADYPFTATDRPRPYDAATNPRIQVNRCHWFARRGGGIALSAAWPWTLAWLSQGIFSQYAEITVDAFTISTLDSVGACVLYSAAAGSMDPDVYGAPPSTPLMGNYGLYVLNLAHFAGEDRKMRISYNTFGGNPSGDVSGNRGFSGINGEPITPYVPISQELPSTFRLEARRQGSQWILTAFQDGNLVVEGADNRLLQGLPGMTAGQYTDDLVANPIAILSRFRGGSL